MTVPDVLLNGLEAGVRLVGAGGSIVPNQGRLTLQGAFQLSVADTLSKPEDLATGMAFVVREGSDYRLEETSQSLAFAWPSAVRLTDDSDPQSPWARFAIARLLQPRGAKVAILSVDRLAVSLIADAKDPGDDFLVHPTRLGARNMALAKPLHPDFDYLSGYFIYPTGKGLGIMLGQPPQRTNISHAEALELVFAQRRADLWFRLPGNGRSAGFVAKANAARGIALVATSSAAAGLVSAIDPGAKQWGRVDLGIREVSSLGGRLRVTSDPESKTGGFESGRVWLARAGSSVTNATGVFTPTDRLELELELPLEAEITSRLPYMTIGYQSRDTGSRFDRHFGLRVAGLAGRSGTAATLDTNFARFHLMGSRAQPQLHLKAGVTPGTWVAPKVDADGLERTLEIAVGNLALNVASAVRPDYSPISIDTETEALTLRNANVIGAPLGVSSKEPTNRGLDDTPRFKRWRLVQEGADPKLEFKLTPDGLEAPTNWISSFRTADPTQSYSAVDHPGMGLIIDGEASRVSAALAEDVRTSFTITNVGGKEVVVYSAFIAVLAYVGAKRQGTGNWEFLDPYKTLLQFNKLDTSPYVKNATEKGLQLIYVSDDGGATQGLRDWIESNRASSKNPAAPEYFWPFTNGLAVPLRSVVDGRVEYADDIIRRRHQNPARGIHPAIAFDFSSEAILDPHLLKLPSWETLAQETPVLWPRASGETGARLDPSVADWRGIFMRDLPLELAVNPSALQKLPQWARDLVKVINQHLVLDYAYRDEAGVTWKGGLLGLPAEGKKISPTSWDNYFQSWLHGVKVLGAANATRGADCEVEFVLPKLKKKNSTPSDSDDSVRVRANFGLDIDSEESPVTRIDVSFKDDPFETDSIPGFKSVSLKRIATNLELVQLQVELVATDTLAQALPFLANGKPQTAFLAFDLKGRPSGVFDLSLPAEAETNLFGRWPLKVQSMQIGWGNIADAWVQVNGRINLGLAGLSSIGATVQITERGGDLDFDVIIQDIGVKLSLPGAKISGQLGWGDPNPATSKVAFADIAQPAVQRRDIRGSLSLETDGFLGNSDLAFRAGNQGEISYWVASAIQKGKPLNLGFGQLSNPGLLLAQNADFGGNLSQLALNPQGEIFSRLRPQGAVVWDWLDKWVPSKDIGTVLAASGYFGVDEVVLKAPVKEGDKSHVEPKWLSGVLWIESGVLRIDGVARLITETPAYFGMAVDFKKRTFFASFDTDPIDLGRYKFKAGRVTIKLSFSTETSLFAGIGWPPRIGPLERDFGQSLHFHLPEVPPPFNAGWGGVMGSVEKGTITLGIAFRIGWMKGDGEAKGGSGGGYSIGYALGGVMEYSLPFNAGPMVLKAPLPTSKLKHAGYADAADAVLAELERWDLGVSGEWYGDVWGSAWLKFMGITLVAIELKAFARYRLQGTLNDGITDARATCGFRVSVTILCVKYTCDARYDIVPVDGGGKVRFDELFALGAAMRPGLCGATLGNAAVMGRA